MLTTCLLYTSSGAAGSVFASYLRKGGADIILIDRYEAHMKLSLIHI